MRGLGRGGPVVLLALPCALAAFFLGRRYPTHPLPSSTCQCAPPAAGAVVAAGPTSGFYLPDSKSHFHQLGKATFPDNAVWHERGPVGFDAAYSKYFELLIRPGQGSVKRLMLLGLGCHLGAHNIGASAKLWRLYLPDAAIWAGEYNQMCAHKHSAALTALSIGVLTGERSDFPTLLRWIQESGGAFDAIVATHMDERGRDGQMYNTFMVLFQQALNPGGVFFLEDVFRPASSGPAGGGGGDETEPVLVAAIRDWTEQLVTKRGSSLGTGEEPTGPTFKDDAGKEHVFLPRRIKSIECFSGFCAVTKCFADDQRCDAHRQAGPGAGAAGGRQLMAALAQTEAGQAVGTNG